MYSFNKEDAVLNSFHTVHDRAFTAISFQVLSLVVLLHLGLPCNYIGFSVKLKIASLSSGKYSAAGFSF